MQNDIKNKFKKNNLTFKKRYKFLLLKDQGKNYILVNEQKKPETKKHTYLNKIKENSFTKSTEGEEIVLKLITGEALVFVPYKNPPKIKQPNPTQKLKTKMDLLVFDKHKERHPLSIHFNHYNDELILTLNEKAYENSWHCQKELFEIMSQCPFEILIKEDSLEVFLSKKDKNAFMKELGAVMWFYRVKDGSTDEEIKQEIIRTKNSPIIFEQVKEKAMGVDEAKILVYEKGIIVEKQKIVKEQQ